MAAKALDRSLTWEALIVAATLGCGVIMLGRGEFTLVDEEMLEDLDQFYWLVNSNGYAVRKVWSDGSQFTERMHRRIMGDPSGFEVDHRFGNRLDNRYSQLRTCTHIQNSGNAKKTTRPDARSQYKGVVWAKSGAKWEAWGRFNYQRVVIGRFETEIEAACAYDKWALARWGEFAKLNFPL